MENMNNKNEKKISPLYDTLFSDLNDCYAKKIVNELKNKSMNQYENEDDRQM